MSYINNWSFDNHPRMDSPVTIAEIDHWRKKYDYAVLIRDNQVANMNLVHQLKGYDCFIRMTHPHYKTEHISLVESINKDKMEHFGYVGFIEEILSVEDKIHKLEEHKQKEFELLKSMKSDGNGKLLPIVEPPPKKVINEDFKCDHKHFSLPTIDSFKNNSTGLIIIILFGLLYFIMIHTH